MSDSKVDHVPGGDAFGRALQGLGYGVAEFDRHPSTLVAYADPELEEIAFAYQSVNDYMQKLAVRGELWAVRHITGEARALVDTAHRRLLRTQGKSGRSSQVACYFRCESAPSALDFVRRQREHWGRVTWFDLVDILALAASGVVTVHVLPEQEPVHFSLFAPDHVLLQARHTHPDPKKHVWFLHFPHLFAHLEPRVQQKLVSAREIPSGSFNSLLDELFALETILVGRWAAGRMSHGELRREISDAESERGLEILRAVGFCEASPGISLKLTAQGRSWLNLSEMGGAAA